MLHISRQVSVILIIEQGCMNDVSAIKCHLRIQYIVTLYVSTCTVQDIASAALQHESSTLWTIRAEFFPNMLRITGVVINVSTGLKNFCGLAVVEFLYI